ncbi:hypothetical protein [Thalassospira xiamenensis]|uniref:Uncharacterized protein n=1 Tax=Thalassospira xiamenensis TaxID=220697 RepID=A0A367XHR6_9PROT|nr:hypothetical protein [Thalassospira xiamenensis]KZB51116.1 hypothetical protein AUP41_08405 [Thalassospira xiamenensis]RCK53195.1 hypothetical protein TH44_03100 [Thalassospira xiamenensis]
MKFPLKDGREVEIVRPFSYRSVDGQEMLNPSMFECANGDTVSVDEIDGDNVTAEHARWFMSFSKQFYQAVSEAYRSSENRNKCEQG